jgi:hypothetical protein
VCLTWQDEAATSLSALGKRALRMLGADQAIEKMETSDIYVLIGRKVRRRPSGTSGR